VTANQHCAGTEVLLATTGDKAVKPRTAIAYARVGSKEFARPSDRSNTHLLDHKDTRGPSHTCRDLLGGESPSPQESDRWQDSSAREPTRGVARAAGPCRCGRCARAAGRTAAPRYGGIPARRCRRKPPPTRWIGGSAQKLGAPVWGSWPGETSAP